jgi:hypothetical protein
MKKMSIFPRAILADLTVDLERTATHLKTFCPRKGYYIVLPPYWS